MDATQQHGVDWRRLFRRPGFGFLFAAMFVSLFGTGMNFAGVTWYIFATTGSTVTTALITVLVVLPGLFVPPFGGVLIDRVDRRYLGIALDVARGGVVLGATLLLTLGWAEVWHILLMMFLLGIGFSIYWSTAHALLQEVAGRKDLVAANSAVLIAVQGGMMTAGALVGFVYQRLHLEGVLAIDGLTYLVSAFCLLHLRSGYQSPHEHTETEEEPPTIEAPAEPQPAGPALESAAVSGEQALLSTPEPEMDRTYISDLKEGLRYLRGQPRVLALGLTYACMMAGVLSGNVLLVVLVKEVLQAGPEGFGYMEAGWALGAVVGGFSLGKMVERGGHGRLLLLALGTLAVGHALFPYVTWLGVAVVMNAVFGMCRALGGVLTQSSIMTIVPRRLMGRTQSAFSVIATVLQILMSLLLGMLAHHISLPVAFGALGAMYALASVTAARAQRMAAARSPAKFL
jgi:MFS family permease